MMLFILEGDRSMLKLVLSPSFLVLLSKVIDEPQLVGILHVTEIESRKIIDLIFNVIAYITSESEDLCENGVHLYSNMSLSEDLSTGL